MKFNIMLRKLKYKLEKIELAKHLKSLKSAQEEVILKVQTKRSYSTDGECDPIDFKKSSNIEYKDKIFVSDLSTDEQNNLGLSIFYVKVGKTTSSPIHKHENRAQLLYIKKGVIYDKIAQIRFEKGESFYISRRNKHSIKYTKGSEILFIYIPGLNEIKN